MADDGSAQSKTVWPLVKFSFVLKIADTEIIFQEVTGLATETQEIEYRAGKSKVFDTIKMPGIKKYGNVTLKKGIYKGEKEFFTWYNHAKMNTSVPQTITISLLDEEQKAIMTWTLLKAIPMKITVTDIKADGNEVAIETLELAFEELKISNETKS